MDRANKALFYAIGASLVAGVVTCYLSFFHGDILSGIFANEDIVIAHSADYLKSYAIDCLLTAFLFCFMGYYTGVGKTVFVMIQGIAGAFCIRIPVSYFVSKIAGVSLFYIGLATPASTIIQIILCGIYFVMCKKKNSFPSIR